MKNRKWLTYTVGILLTLIALTVVGVAGFRVGMMQNLPFARMAFGNNGPMMQNANPADGNNNDVGGNPQFMQGNWRDHDFNNRGFDRGRGGMSIFGGLFGLIHLAVLALLLWFGYKLVKNSGWKLVREQAGTSATTDTPSVEVAEKKE